MAERGAVHLESEYGNLAALRPAARVVVRGDSLDPDPLLDGEDRLCDYAAVRSADYGSAIVVEVIVGNQDDVRSRPRRCEAD